MSESRKLDEMVAAYVFGYVVEVERFVIGHVHTQDSEREDVISERYRLLKDGKLVCAYGPLMHGYGPIELPHYSTTWDGAGRVIDGMREKKFYWGDMSFGPSSDGRMRWHASFHDGRRTHIADDSSAPRAICRAALYALNPEGVEVPGEEKP